MGRVTTEATIENLCDLYLQKRGEIPLDRVRQANVKEAIVDTDTMDLALPTHLIHQLGLSRSGERRAGTILVTTYDAVRLTIMGRDMTIDPIEVLEGSSVLVGRIPLLMLDLVVDIEGQKLVGNPAHGGEQMLELY